MWGNYIITLRFLGRHRSRRHADLGHPVPVPRRLPHVDLSRRRGDDRVRRHDRRVVPDHPHRAPVEVLLAGPVSELAPAVAELQSPLVWDVFAISTYLTISTMFLFIGLIPDIAVVARQGDEPDAQAHPRASCRSAGATATASGGTSTKAYLFLAAFSTPLVLSVHSVVSFDFAMALTPGWHASIFPPYFVAGAIFSGFAMVWTIVDPDAQVVPPRALHHAQPPRCDGQGRAVHVAWWWAART